MGSLRVAGMMAGSALGAGVEVTTWGQGRTSRFGTGNCVSMAGLGFAASLAVAMSGGKRKRSLGQKKAGLGRDSGQHL